MREWFKARNVWGAIITSLPDEEAGRLAKAIWAFTMTGQITQLDGAVNGIFAMILMILQQDEEHDCDVSRKRAIAGSTRHGKSDADISNQLPANDSNCNQLPANDNNCAIKNKSKSKNKEQEKEIILSLFDRFWASYPKHADKQSALRAFQKINPDEALLGVMITAIEKQKASAQWKDSQFIPLPSTWLNKKRWEDEVRTDQPVRIVNAQDYSQRDYSDEQDDAMKRMLEGVRA